MAETPGRLHTWTVVLGSTLRPEVPGSPGSTHAGLKRALDLALSISDPERVVTPLVPDDLAGAPFAHPALSRGHLLYEPADRGTACSLFLALARIQATDPDALVVVLPTGYVADPACAFGARLVAALDAARRIDRVVILGMAPASLEAGHGWILPGSPMARVGQLELRRVETFIERPGHDLASLIMETGGLWSTMMLAATLGRLCASMRRSLPELATAFGPFGDVAGTPGERAWLAALYARLPRRAIASHVLHGLGEDLAVAELESVSRRMLEMLRGAGGLRLPVAVS